MPEYYINLYLPKDLVAKYNNERENDYKNETINIKN